MIEHASFFSSVGWFLVSSRQLQDLGRANVLKLIVTFKLEVVLGTFSWPPVRIFVAQIILLKTATGTLNQLLLRVELSSALLQFVCQLIKNLCGLVL